MARNFRDTLPRGHQLNVNDEAAMAAYSLKNQTNPPLNLNVIREIEFYNSDPATLTGLETLSSSVDGEQAWCFFSRQSTNRRQIAGHGYCTNRRQIAGHGYWEPIMEVNIPYMFRYLGLKKTFVYCEGISKRKRTEWYMNEYTDQGHQSHEWILIMLYHYGPKKDSAAPGSAHKELQRMAQRKIRMILQAEIESGKVCY